MNGHNEAIIGDFGFNGKRGDNNNANDGKHYSEKTNANAMQKQPPQHLIEAHGHDSGARVAPAHVQKRDDQINLPSSTEQIGAEQQNNGDQSFISSDHNAEHIQVGDSTSCVNNGYEFEGYMHSGDAFVNRHPTANFRGVFLPAILGLPPSPGKAYQSNISLILPQYFLHTLKNR